MRATIDDLDDVSGVGETRARAIKEGLSRLAESSILDRYSSLEGLRPLQTPGRAAATPPLRGLRR